MAKPLLTLETAVPDRPIVEIDGQPYGLALPEDFGLLESAGLDGLMRKAADAQRRAAELPAKDPVRPEFIAELKAILDDVIAVILLAPEDVRARLSSNQQLAVIAAFTPEVERRRRPPRTESRRRSRLTSGSSSQSSRRRTARGTGGRCRSVS